MTDLSRGNPSSWQRQIPNPLGEARDQARDQTRTLEVTTRVHFCYTTTGHPKRAYFKVTIKNKSW